MRLGSDRNNSLVFSPWDDEAVGYLDPRSQSFKQTIVDLAESIVAADGVRK